MRLVIGLIFLFFAGCNSEKPKTLNMSDIVPSSEKYKEGEVKETPKPQVFYYDTLSTFSRLVSDTLGMWRQSVQLSDTVLLPNRFIFKSKETWIGFNADDKYFVGVWTYHDSLETKNAFFNWLDCFGKRCETIQLYEQKKVNNGSFLICATEKKMIYINATTSLNVKQQLENLQAILPREKITFALSHGVARKTEWWELANKKWTIRDQKSKL